MAGKIAQHFIDKLLTHVDIVDVVQPRVSLKKAGKEWTACCPFHDEQTPSFTVSPQKQFYHCFGCGAHGSAIGFLMNYEHLAFPDAVEELAQLASLPVVYAQGEYAAPKANHQSLYELMDAVTRWYQTTLSNQTSAYQYCTARGLDAATIKHFRLGFAPDQWQGVFSHFGTSPDRVEQLNKVGLLSTSQKGRQYDRFRNRLMFPIFDRRGRIIAFGGRVIDKDQSPKYLNSPGTELFHKGRELFGLWQARQAGKLERLIVVEGYMDVIALYQAGITGAVATLGTATTREHTQQLFRTAPHIVFCFDGDRAGRAAAWKALEAALPHLRDGRQANFLCLPEGEDPDSLVRQQGQDHFNQLLDQATPLSTFLFDTLRQDINTSHIDGRANLAEKARPLLLQLPQGAFRDLMGQELEKQTGVTLKPAPTRAKARQSAPTRRGKKPSLVRTTITLLLAEPSLAATVTPPYAFAKLNQRGIDLLHELIEIIHSHPEIHTAGLLEHFRDQSEYASLSKLAAQPATGNLDTAREFSGAMEQLKRQAQKQRIGALLQQKANTGLTEEEKGELRQLLQEKSLAFRKG